MTRRASSIVAGLLAVLYAFSAAVQYNDPDPMRWFAIYAASALLAGLCAASKAPRVLLLGVAFVALAWAATILPSVIEAAAFTGTEEEREMAGLLLVTSGLLALARWSHAPSRVSSDAGSGA